MRILLAVSPLMYRESLAHLIRTNRPNAQVHLAEPEDLAREAASFGPHLIVCSEDAREVQVSASPHGWCSATKTT